MYKIMIADDEGITIDFLSMLIQKNFGDSCIIESAKTGRNVIELAERFRPDIAFMDIQMPGINGIDAMMEIQKSNQQICFIVMSAYDKFDYAKRSIQLGVIDYLMKPASMDKILTTLTKAMKLVEEAREKREIELKNKEKLETVVPMIENNFIYTMLFQEEYSDEIENFRTLLEIKQEYGYVCVAEFGEEYHGNQFTNPIGANVRAQRFYTEFCDLAKKYFPCIIGPVMANQIILLIPCEAMQEEYTERIETIDNARQLVHKLQERCNMRFRIGIGSAMPLQELRVSYQEAKTAMKNLRGSAAHIKDYIVASDRDTDYPKEQETMLIFMMKTGNILKMQEEAEGLFAWINEHAEGDLDKMKAKILELYYYSLREMQSQEQLPFLQKLQSGCFSEICGIISIASLRQWFLEQLKGITYLIKERKENSSNQVIDRAKEYIRKQIKRDLSLDEVSKEVNISPYYFSKIFKEETGENFIEYVTKCRMNLAKQLLMDENKSIKEICMEAGFSDPNYFSRIFKKYVGLTPTEFRGGA